MAAVARAPSEPTMAESMYCMAMELTSANMAGTLKRITSPICCQSVVDASGLSHWPQSISFDIPSPSRLYSARRGGGPFCSDYISSFRPWQVAVFISVRQSRTIPAADRPSEQVGPASKISHGKDCFFVRFPLQ